MSGIGIDAHRREAPICAKRNERTNYFVGDELSDLKESFERYLSKTKMRFNVRHLATAVRRRP
jgi:hypothetical protein